MEEQYRNRLNEENRRKCNGILTKEFENVTENEDIDRIRRTVSGS